MKSLNESMLMPLALPTNLILNNMPLPFTPPT